MPESFNKPILKPAELPGNPQAVVLTIAKVDFRQSQFRNERTGNRDTKCVLEFAEVTDRELWIGKRGTTALIKHYGDESDVWLGKSVPVTCVLVSMNGAHSTVVQIAAREWQDVMRKYARGRHTAAPTVSAQRKDRGRV